MEVRRLTKKNDELYHYGVKGMKWRHHKSTSSYKDPNRSPGEGYTYNDITNTWMPPHTVINGHNVLTGEPVTKKDRSDDYKKEAWGIKEQQRIEAGKKSCLSNKLGLFKKAFKEVHTENLNNVKRKVSNIIKAFKS